MVVEAQTTRLLVRGDGLGSRRGIEWLWGFWWIARGIWSSERRCRWLDWIGGAPTIELWLDVSSLAALRAWQWLVKEGGGVGIVHPVVKVEFQRWFSGCDTTVGILIGFGPNILVKQWARGPKELNLSPEHCGLLYWLAKPNLWVQMPKYHYCFFTHWYCSGSLQTRVNMDWERAHCCFYTPSIVQ